MSEYTLTIDGRSVEGASSYLVQNPATGADIALAPTCDQVQLDQAFAAGARAQPAWAADEAGRLEALDATARALEEHADELGAIITAEQGKPIRQGAGEFFAAAAWFRYFTTLATNTQIIQDDDQARIEVVRRPVGVVAAITPWNFPVALGAWKLAPALRAGNTVVLKPSPFTPLATLRLGELLRGILPPGVLNVVSGGDELGRMMTAHTVPRKISFTGSTSAGLHVAAAAAKDLKHTTLELGGNDPAIVLPDADVDATAEQILAAATANCGQVCTAVKRVYAHALVVDDLVERLAVGARAINVGDGTDPDVTMGPLTTAAQLKRVTGLVADALDHGARAVTGGSPTIGPGFFYPPTVLDRATDGMPIVDEEQFGPVIPVASFSDDHEVVTRANNSPFGLSASIWTRDTEHARALADRLECGTTWINTHLVVGPHQPFGGIKHSGLGVENGQLGLESYTEPRVVHTRR